LAVFGAIGFVVLGALHDGLTTLDFGSNWMAPVFVEQLNWSHVDVLPEAVLIGTAFSFILSHEACLSNILVRHVNQVLW
jgi:hypothetical protein